MTPSRRQEKGVFFYSNYVERGFRVPILRFAGKLKKCLIIHSFS